MMKMERGMKACATTSTETNTVERYLCFEYLTAPPELTSSEELRGLSAIPSPVLADLKLWSSRVSGRLLRQSCPPTLLPLLP